MSKLLRRYVLYLAFLQALLATLGSLFFSEVSRFTPCILCWYQRICLYPLVVILIVGILTRDKYLHLYVLPLSIAGFLIALYQNLLTWGVVSEATSPCQIGVSCTIKYINWFGFVTIPFLSALSFAVLITCVCIYKRYNTK